MIFLHLWVNFFSVSLNTKRYSFENHIDSSARDLFLLKGSCDMVLSNAINFIVLQILALVLPPPGPLWVRYQCQYYNYFSITTVIYSTATITATQHCTISEVAHLWVTFFYNLCGENKCYNKGRGTLGPAGPLSPLAPSRPLNPYTE